MKFIHLLLILTAIFTSCENNYQQAGTEDKATAYEMLPPPAAAEDMHTEGYTNGNSAGKAYTATFSDASANNTTANTQSAKIPAPNPAPQKKLIKNGRLHMQVEDYKETRPKINQLIAQHQGYIGSENETNTGNVLQNNITIRVPFNTFDGLVNDLEKLAKYIESKTVNVQDVTAQFVDIEGRLKTRREVMERYMDFLKKAKNIDETLKIEEQIRQLREEIESAEGQLKLLRDQVSYSTLELRVYENLPYQVTPSTETGFFAKIVEAFKSGWRIMLNFIVGITYLWPFIIAGLILLFFLRRKFRNNAADAKNRD